MSWYEVYLEDIKKKNSVENYVQDKIKNKKNLINLIKKYSYNKKIIESGSGTGVISTYMASLGFDATAIDINDDILKLSIDISKRYDSKEKPKFLKKSIFCLDYEDNSFDVSFSNGVLEHFKDEEIIDTLIQQMRISKTVIFGIPTKYFNKKEAMYGDERYLDYSYWRALIKKANGVIIEEKTMHYLGLIDRIKNIKKYFKPYPFKIFVIMDKSKYTER